MPLIVGIENAIDKGFAPNEIELLHSFEMGALAMTAGIGRINPDIENAPDRYNNIGVDEATERFSVAIHACGFIGCAAGRYKPYEDEELSEWQQELQASERLLFDVLKDRDFVQRMADNDWSCNVGNTSPEEFQFAIMKRVAEDTWRDAGYKSYGDKPAIVGAPRLTYKRICKDAELIESLVIKHLGGDAYIHMGDVVQHYTEEHLSYDTSKPLSNGMYLHWDDDAYEWSLEDTQQEA
jgi:hypothetical protein